MSCSSTGCQKTADPIAAPQVEDAAGRLACLLAENETFQNFVRLARAVRLDGEVVALVNKINDQVYANNPFAGDGSQSDELEARLEAMPLIREYRSAESAARELFRAVDQAISGVVGIAFAENARSCGHG